MEPDLRIPAPHSRASFRDFLKAMQREHALCRPTTGTVALKAYRRHFLRDDSWNVTLLCDVCGGFTITLTAQDHADLNASDPGWLMAPPPPCDECGETE